MRRLALLCLIAVFVIIAILLTPNRYFLNIAVFAGINALLAISLNLLLGFAGQVSLGHAAFYGLGAYGVGVLSTHYSWPVWLCLPAALLGTGVIAYLIGLPTMRLKGHYLALATLGFGIIVKVIFDVTPSLTGGPSGLIGIPNLTVGRLVISGDRNFALLVWLSILIVQGGIGNLRASRLGRALYAIQENETAASALGIDTGREKRAVFVASAMLAAFAGCIYAYYMSVISPESFGFGFSVQVLTMTVLGGLGSLWGPVLGALLLTVLPEVFRRSEDYQTIIYGLLLILAVMFLPQGLTGGARRLWRRLKEV